VPSKGAFVIDCHRMTQALTVPDPELIRTFRADYDRPDAPLALYLDELSGCQESAAAPAW
jgi:hypothetical protein